MNGICIRSLRNKMFWSVVFGVIALSIFNQILLNFNTFNHFKVVKCLQMTKTKHYVSCLLFVTFRRQKANVRTCNHADLSNSKGHIATSYCDVLTEKIVFKGEQMHVRIWSNGLSTSLVCIYRLCFFTYMCFQGGGGGVGIVVECMDCLPCLTLNLWENLTPLCTSWFNFGHCSTCTRFKLYNNLLIR